MPSALDSRPQSEPQSPLRLMLAQFAGVGALRIGAMLMGTISAILVARVLGPAGYGEIAFVLAIMSLVSIPSNNAVGPLLVREVSGYQQSASWSMLAGFCRWIRRSSLGVSIGSSLLLVGWAAWLHFSDSPELSRLVLLTAPMVVLWSLAALGSGTLQGLKRVALAQSFDWFVNPAIYLLLVLLLWASDGISAQSVLTSLLIALAVGALLSFYTSKRHLPTQTAATDYPSNIGRWKTAWKNFVLLQVLAVASMKVPIVLISTLSDDAQTGLFRVAENVASLLAISILIADAVIAPHIASLYQANDLQALERLAKNTARATFAISLPLVLLVALFGRDLLAMVFGASYQSAFAALVVLVIGQAVNLACGAVGLLLNMTGHESEARRPLVASLLLNLFLCFALIPTLGALGAAIASSVATISWNLLLLGRTKKHLGVSPAVI